MVGVLVSACLKHWLPVLTYGSRALAVVATVFLCQQAAMIEGRFWALSSFLRAVVCSST
jgi:hypothetical protein